MIRPTPCITSVVRGVVAFTPRDVETATPATITSGLSTAESLSPTAKTDVATRSRVLEAVIRVPTRPKNVGARARAVGSIQKRIAPGEGSSPNRPLDPFCMAQRRAEAFGMHVDGENAERTDASPLLVVTDPRRPL